MWPLSSSVRAMRAITIIAIAMLIGCSVTPVKPTIAVPENQADCEASGGSWQCLGLGGDECPMACRVETTDAGRECQDSVDCQGVCIAPSREARTGSCSAFNTPFGCQFYLNGVRKPGGPALCID